MLPEVLSLALLSIGVYGTYQGIEITHPIYALLFTNLIFPAVATTINLLVLTLLQFRHWVRLSLFFNFFSLLFHMTSWSVISVMRYIFIEHQDWINNRWPDVTKLKPHAIFAQFASFFFFLFFNTLGYAIGASPYGWPQKSFIKHVPFHVQMYLGFFTVAIFTSPVIISGVFYILLVCSRSRQSATNKVHVAHVAPQFSNDDDLNNEQNVVNYNSNIPCISTEEMDRVESRPNMEDTGRRRVSFEYNQILRENGFPFENEADLEKSRNLIKLSYFPHSVDVHSNMKRSGPKESMELHNFIETRTKIKLEHNL